MGRVVRLVSKGIFPRSHHIPATDNGWNSVVRLGEVLLGGSGDWECGLVWVSLVESGVVRVCECEALPAVPPLHSLSLITVPSSSSVPGSWCAGIAEDERVGISLSSGTDF